MFVAFLVSTVVRYPMLLAIVQCKMKAFVRRYTPTSNLAGNQDPEVRYADRRELIDREVLMSCLSGFPFLTSPI